MDPRKSAEPPSSSFHVTPAFPVVGIGASAGGLPALTTLLENMPPAPGIALVVVLHLSPDYLSAADRLLQRATDMPVVQVTRRMPIRPNRVYVISPGRNLRMEEGELVVEDVPCPLGIPMTINIFMRALAIWGCTLERIEQLWAGQGPWRAYRSDGTLLEQGESPLARVLASGEPVVNQELNIKRPDGSFVDILVNITALRDAAGQVSGAINIFQDISERKRAEEALRTAGRRKDEFLAKLAHELRNPLAPISNAVQFLRRPEGRANIDRWLDMAERQVRQMVRMLANP